MTVSNILILILTTVFSGLLGVIISNVYHKKQQIRTIKIELVKNVLGYRYQLTENYEDSQKEILFALNQILVIFNDSDIVINALIKYHETKSINDLVSLIKSMCDDAKIEYKYNDILFTTPFAGKLR
jgi:hypothetical protein